MLPSTLRHLVYCTLVFSLSVFLTACGGSSGNGGGGGASSQAASNSSAAESSTDNQSSADSESSESTSSSSSSSQAPDREPDAFSFEPQTDVMPGEEELVSNTVTISGINTAVEVGITGGEYRINGGAFTAEAGEVSNGDGLTLRANAPEEPEAAKEVTLKVGTAQEPFAITTMADEEPPEAAFAFPPPATATDEDTLTVRGTATDELSDVASVQLRVESEDGTETHSLKANEDDGLETWRQEITLAPGDNTVYLSARDEYDNKTEEEKTITVRQQGFDEPFPDDEVPFMEIWASVLDEKNGRLFVAGAEDFDWPDDETRHVIEVDLLSGERSILSGVNVPEGTEDIRAAPSLAHDVERDRLVLGTNSKSILYEVDLGSSELGVLFEWDDIEENSEGITIDPNDPDYAYLVSRDDSTLRRISLEDGSVEVISSTELEQGEGPAFDRPHELLVKEGMSQGYILEDGDSHILKVNLNNGDRTSVDVEEYPRDIDLRPLPIDGFIREETIYILDRIQGVVSFDMSSKEWGLVRPFELQTRFEGSISGTMEMVDEGGYLLLSDSLSSGVYAVDLTTKEYVTVSKSSEP